MTIKRCMKRLMLLMGAMLLGTAVMAQDDYYGNEYRKNHGEDL